MSQAYMEFMKEFVQSLVNEFPQYKMVLHHSSENDSDEKYLRFGITIPLTEFVRAAHVMDLFRYLSAYFYDRRMYRSPEGWCIGDHYFTIDWEVLKGCCAIAVVPGSELYFGPWREFVHSTATAEKKTRPLEEPHMVLIENG